MAADEEGDVGRPPVLSAESVKLGITDATRATRGTQNYPQKHWSGGMQAGQWKIVDRIVYEHEPRPDRGKILLAGFAADDQPNINISPPADGDPKPVETVHARQLELAAWLAKHYGQGLAADDQKTLAKIYIEAAETGHKYSSAHPTYKTPQEYEAVRAELAAASAALLINEHQIFRAAPAQAQQRRYGKPLPPHAAPNARMLQKKFDQFRQGRYFETDRARAAASRPASIIDRSGLPARSALEYAFGLRYYTDYAWIGAPEIIGYEGRCFVAEHDAGDVDWDLWGIPGIYHTSVVGGIWRIERQRRTATRYSSDGGSTPQLLETRQEVVTQAKFAGWRVGNGCASTYAAADNLRQFYGFSGASWDDVDKILFGYTPTEDGRYYPIRGVAYSVGNYGIHWVCHQTANSFSVRRWGISPVTYLASILLHHMYGNLGISQRMDFLHQVHRGCVPGVNCFYNIMPPYSIPEPITVGIMEAGMSGAGYLLQTLWNRRKAQWIESAADFDPVLVPCQAHDEVISIDRV